jgi:hypothetical protein
VAKNAPKEDQLKLKVYMRYQAASIVNNAEYVADADFLEV